MASKRMFAIQIIDSDAFLDMPLTTQSLYFHLSMRADDDGFIDNPKRIMRLIGSMQNDLDLLIFKRFILTFENGIIVIKHWRLHNTIQKDRYKETVYLEEKDKLILKQNKVYTERNKTLELNNEDIEELEENPECIQNGNNLETQIRLDKVRLDKNSKDKTYIVEDNNGNNSKIVKEIIDYLNLKTNKNFKHTTAKTKSLINARLNDGFTLEDFKRVVDVKTAEWLGDERWSKYLQPSTLFSNNFDNYLNQEMPKKKKDEFSEYVGNVL